MSILNWLGDLGLLRSKDVFLEHAIDADVLPHLTAEDLTALGITKVGDRRRLLEAIARLPRIELDSPTARLSVTSAADATPMERRRLTVMFYDLVGSTSLSVRIDPEELSEIIATYQRTMSANIQRFGGYVARVMGDGGLVYFGYPQAHEDDPERAVRAALEAVTGMDALPAIAGFVPKIQVGIATGVVIVGDIVGAGGNAERDVAGQTPNLAARLQAVAEPGGVLICATTERLVRKSVNCASLGLLELKGFNDPVQAFVVQGINKSTPRKIRRSTLAPLIGRQGEMDQLLRKMESGIAGRGPDHYSAASQASENPG